MKKLLLIIVVGSFLFSCGKDKSAENSAADAPGYEAPEAEAKPDTGKGLGQVTEVTLNTPLEQERIGRGKAIYEMKCQACHKLDEVRVVGPGWKGVTQRRKPEWIMNMITNVEVMLEKDAEAQKLLELCLTRMPNQNVSIGDARDVLEFMRQNDGEK
jgi:cytochrome c5